jgi:hypothetical protein
VKVVFFVDICFLHAENSSQRWACLVNIIVQIFKLILFECLSKIVYMMFFKQVSKSCLTIPLDIRIRKEEVEFSDTWAA